MSISDQLKEMGFNHDIVEHAMKEAGSSIEQAMEWILANQDNFQPSSSSMMATSVVSGITATSSTGAADEEYDDEIVPEDKRTEEGQKANSIRCDDCGKLFKNEDALVWHASKTKHSNFSQSAEEIKQKTPEEMLTAKKALEERIKQNRVKNAEREQREEFERERTRRNHGREIVNMRQKFKEDEIVRLAEERRRDKLEDAKSRQRILDQIARDKEERKCRQAGLELPKKTPEKIEPPPPRNYDEAKLQIRLTNGHTMVATFKVDEQLSAVRCYILTNRSDGGADFQLMTTFPKKIFSDSDMARTLKDLGLVPTAVLILNPVKTLNIE